MNDLVEFLRERLAEDERAALEARGKRWHIGNAIDPTKPCNVHEFPTVRLIADNCGWLEAEHIARWNPERILAEVEAKRQIMRGHAQAHECPAFTGGGERSMTDGQPWELWEPKHTGDYGPCFVLRCLALPYASHPDYREEWRP